MIQGKSRNENEKAYREITLDSSSSLKDFSVDRKKYYRKYILNENVEDKETQSQLMGKIVETLLMEPEKFDSRFYMSACAEAPTGLMLKFVEALYDVAVESTGDDGILTRSFSDMCQIAFAASGFSGKGSGSYDNVMKKFIGSDNEIYYNEIRTVRARGLNVVTPDDVAIAEKIVEELKTNEVTKDIVNLIGSARYSVYDQYQVEDFEIDGYAMKGMMDKVIVDHLKKTVQVYDIKCTWSVENFYKEYYLYRRSYIQAYVYYKGAERIAGELENESGEQYKVLPIRFIVCDSTNYYSPLIYKLSEKDLEDAYNGFEHNGYKYPGVKSIIQDLKWALENNIWNISRENYENKGVVKLC